MRCFPTSGTFNFLNSPDRGFGGGPLASGVTTCPPTYDYFGTSCSNRPVEAERSYSDAVAQCANSAASPDILYFPSNQMQNVVFRRAMNELVY